MQKEFINIPSLFELREKGFSVATIAERLRVDEETVRTVLGGFDQYVPLDKVQGVYVLRRAA